MYRLNKYLLYYNFFISICAVALVFYFSIVTSTKVSPVVYPLTFFGTLGIYNLFRLYPSFKDYLQQRRWFSFELILLSFVIGTICFLLLPKGLKLLYIPPLLLAIAYKFPIIDKKDLRSIPYLKVFIIAIVWIMIGSIPILNNQLYDEETTRKIIIMMISQFLFFISITIPFDVFDVEKDRIKTLATGIGIQKAMLIAKTCLVLHLLCVILKRPSVNEIIAHLIICGITFTILSFHKKITHRGLQYYFIDGLIILQTLIIYFLH